MSSPGLKGVMTVDAVSDSLNEIQRKKSVERGADAALTARAVVVVTFGGAGIWYLLWKLALLFVEGR